jgi:hypothetical protein
MAAAKIEEGHTDADTILQHIHEAIAEHTPLERSEIADILIGHVEGAKKPTKSDLQQRKEAFYKELKDRQAGGEEGKKITALEKAIAKAEEAIAAKKPAPGKEQGPEGEDVTRLRAELKARNAELSAIRRTQRPLDTVDTNMLKNAARQAVIKKEIAKIEARIAAKDYRPPEKVEPYTKSTETERAQGRLNDLRAEFERDKRIAEKQNRSTSAKVADMIVELHRAAVLTSPNVLLKLPMTALSNIALRPVLETIGKGASKVYGLRDIAAKARSEGGAGSLIGGELAAAGATFSRDTVAAMLAMAKTGTHELASRFDKRHEQDFTSDFRLTQFVGNLHGALKVPAVINQWTRAVHHINESEANDLRAKHVSEEDIAIHLADPATKARIGAEAWLSAKREIFQNDNVFSTAYEALLGRLSATSKKGGLAGTSAGAAERVARFLLPITKVPTNIGIAASSYAGGILGAMAHIVSASRHGEAAVKAGKADDAGAWKNMVNALTPEQADSIMRNLKRQTVGLAAMAIGVYFYQNFGGMYQQGDSKNRLKPESETIDTHMRDLNIPMIVDKGRITKQVLEHPLLTAMQLGATAAWVAHKPKNDMSEGAWAAATSLARKNPFASAIMDVANTGGTLKGAEKYAGRMASSMNPQMIQWLARRMDTSTYSGNEIKRTPQNFWQEIEQGVPVMRENVPRSKIQPQ